MASLRQQWRALTPQQRYEVAMFVALMGIPGLVLVAWLVVIVVGTLVGFVAWEW